MRSKRLPHPGVNQIPGKPRICGLRRPSKRFRSLPSACGFGSRRLASAMPKLSELFCGRGNGLHALQRLGFTRFEGVDLSAHLLAQYHGDAKCIVADCRKLRFADRSKDFLIVQGGLHHLPTLPGDLDQTFQQMHRVLRKDGRVVLVEPWQTPFLRIAHLACANAVARRISNKVDALATMIHYERRTYKQWLSQPEMILKLARKYFSPEQEHIAWGKWSFVGAPV